MLDKNNKRPLLDADANNDRPTKKQKQDELERLVNDLWRSKADPDFPVRCYDAITRTIAPLLDQGSGSFVLPLQEAPGKKLSTVLVVGTACAQHGLETLTRARKSFDAAKLKEQLQPTKSWVSWVRADRATDPLLRDIKLTKWSSISQHFVNPMESLPDSVFDSDDDELPEWIDLDEEVAKCFTEHTLEETTAQQYAHEDYTTGFDCDDCCLKTFDECAPMYRCGTCDMDYCKGCVQRRPMDRVVAVSL